MFDELWTKLGVDADVGHDIDLEIHKSIRENGERLVEDMISELNDNVFFTVDAVLDDIEREFYHRKMEEPDVYSVSEAFYQELEMVLYNEALQQMLDFCKEKLCKLP